MPTFVLILMALIGAALGASVCFLAGFAIQSLWLGQLTHLPAEYLRTVVVFTFENALVYAILLGAPLLTGLHRLGWLRWWVSALAGFLIGAIPTAIRFWPLRHVASNVVSVTVMRGGRLVQTVHNGVPTLAGWLDYTWSVLAYAAVGALGGLLFWFLWRKLEPALARLPARR